MQNVDYMEVAGDALQQIKSGAFLTVQSGDIVNVMTIGWASIGFLWGRPMFSIMVRPTRFTFQLIEKSNEFTVAIPQTDMKSALDFCGTTSGKKIDKFKGCNLEIVPGKKVKTPLIKLQGLNFECAIVYKSVVDSVHLSETYTHLYPGKDFHTIYYGEIRSCYSTLDEDA
jgi:flavin reductase (DIM6/NTAB) family NADH-FMN oxidoreductase RutF